MSVEPGRHAQMMPLLAEDVYQIFNEAGQLSLGSCVILSEGWLLSAKAPRRLHLQLLKLNSDLLLEMNYPSPDPSDTA